MNPARQPHRRESTSLSSLLRGPAAEQREVTQVAQVGTSRGRAHEQWSGHVREALEILPDLETEMRRMGRPEGGDVMAWVRAISVATVLLEEEAERLGRADLRLSTPEPLRHRQRQGAPRREGRSATTDTNLPTIHTPGPWRISDNPYGAIVSDYPTGRPGESGSTTAEGLHFPGECEIYGGYVVCESVLPKDKPLIAAAPEMFDTLRFAEAWITRRGIQCVHNGYHRPGECPEANEAEAGPQAALSASEALPRIRDLLSRIERAEAEEQGGEAA